MRRAFVYFGVEVPDHAWSTSLRDADVVLEPFHPLVQDGGFAERFPDAHRYVYVNPTSVDPWLLANGGEDAPVVAWDQRWGLPRLDLSTSEGMDWAVRTAVEAAALDSSRHRGLFVDDLDRLLPGDQESALEFLRRVRAEVDGVRWFVNRAFSLWDRIPDLDAVLLEDIAPALTRHAPAGEIRWMRDHVLPAVDAVRARGVAVHAVAYGDQDGLYEAAPDLVFERDLSARLDSVTTGVGRAAASWEVFA